MLTLGSPEEMEAALAESLVPVEVERASPQFSGALMRHDFGDGVALVEGRSQAGVLARTPRLLDASPSDSVLLEVNLRGRCVVAQDGREALVGAGEGALYDARRPYRLELAEENRVRLVHVPRAYLPHTDRVLGAAMARRVDAGLASYRLLVGYLRVVASEPGLPSDADAAALVRRTLADLVCAIVSSLSGDDAHGSRETLLSALQVAVRRDLHDPELSPATLAVRHHVSLRSVHAAFELTSTTPAAYIREMRLRRACELLRGDPRLRVLDVALACGFGGSTTFVRAFGAAYGMSPSAFRARMVPPACTGRVDAPPPAA